MRKESSKEMREYLFEAYNTECVDYCGRVWTVTKAVEFCSKLQSLDKDMLYALLPSIYLLICIQIISVNSVDINITG